MMQQLLEDQLRRKLVGKKITGIRYLNIEEAQSCNIDITHRPVVIQLDDGSQLCPLYEDGDRQTGASILTNIKGLQIIPVY